MVVDKRLFEAKEVNVSGWKEPAYEITVTLSGTVEEYAMNFLHIFNNARESNHVYKCTNHYNSNNVTLWVAPNMVDTVTDYLSQFGEVSDPYLCVMYIMEEPWERAWDEENGIDEWYDKYPGGAVICGRWS